jgi:hypothetical protein
MVWRFYAVVRSQATPVTVTHVSVGVSADTGFVTDLRIVTRGVRRGSTVSKIRERFGPYTSFSAAVLPAHCRKG